MISPATAALQLYVNISIQWPTLEYKVIFLNILNIFWFVITLTTCIATLLQDDIHYGAVN